MTQDAQDKLHDFYVDLRTEGGKDVIPVTARKLEALVRLSEASARVRLSGTVDIDDAERAIRLVKSSLQDVGRDPETGEFDADVIETGTSKTQRDRIKNIESLVSEMTEDEFAEEGAPIEEVHERASEKLGMDEHKVEKEIENLRQKGELYEPKHGYVRKT
jgi:replicative DNA helicase Mcm